jgi:nuclear RNA export factor
MLSLANNGLKNLAQLQRLAFSLSSVRALDLSGNPIHNVAELDTLLAPGEKRGKAVAGKGSLKGLTELQTVGCAFRDKIVNQENGLIKYRQ